MQYHAKVLKKVTTLRVMIILSTVQKSHRCLLTVQREVSMIIQQHNRKSS